MKIRTRLLSVSIGRVLMAVVVVAGLAPWMAPPVVADTRWDIIGPPGSGSFGTSVVLLPNGNIVVTDPLYDDGATANVGAVYLYDGTTLALISTLTGSTADDRVGDGGVTVLTNGNYVVSSVLWDNGAVTDAGAATWGNRTTGIAGVVSAANSLVGTTTGDLTDSRVWALSNGNYVITSPWWGGASTGAATWGNGTTGVSGPISSANSLVSGGSSDRVGWGGVTALNNGNYVVRSPDWMNSGHGGRGAATWGDGTVGVSGVVSADNSLVGSHEDDQVGGSVWVLSSGNYLVTSSYWDNGGAFDAGAVTWGSGTTGVTGTVSAANSLVGTTEDDQVGLVTILSNGNYVVRSYVWDNGGAVDAGAATWGDGTTGVKGAVSDNNSLVGSTPNDQIGYNDVVELSNGNYVVSSPFWDNGAVTDAGAVTWGNGMVGARGVVSPDNSLVGSMANDWVGYTGSTGVWALSNGNYVVQSPWWDSSTVTDAGAVTWANGTTGIVGLISATNSLVGSTVGDQVGRGALTVLNNGNYVVGSVYWDNGETIDVGAATWGDGMVGVNGSVSSANSLVGGTVNDRVSWGGVTALSNGHYVVTSIYWDNGSAADSGAVTWGNGTTGSSGLVSTANSLVGGASGDAVGSGALWTLSNGNYVVASLYWDNGSIPDAGAVTWRDGAAGVGGVVSAGNSLVGTSAYDRIGYGGGVIELSNGNYVVISRNWDSNGAIDVGAVTWGSGMTGISGPVSAATSLVGSAADDQIGSSGVMVLSNGNYVVRSPHWDNGVIPDAGAATWGSGVTGIRGIIAADNSLVGSTANDRVGDQSGPGGVMALPNGHYVVHSPFWDYGFTSDAGAVTWGYGTSGTTGSITGENSICGTQMYGGQDMVIIYDGANGRLVVGRPADNRVTLLKPFYIAFGPVVLKNGP